MDDESMKKLRLDKRLIGRRDWIASGDLKSALESLPDASGKIAPVPSTDSNESSSSDESA